MKLIELLEYTFLIIAIIGIIYLIVKDINKPKEKIKGWVRYLTGIGLAFLLVWCFYVAKRIVVGEQCPTPTSYGCTSKTEILIDAIAEVESGNDTTAKSKTSSAAGHLQQLKVLVDEANRIDTTKHYTYNDRYNKEKAEEIFAIIQDKYNPKWDIETAIRLWYGGPGFTKAGTQEYYDKVIRVYNTKIADNIEDYVRNIQSLNLK
jgi:hypothetical protein